MNIKKIFSVGILFCSLFIFAGCSSQTQTQPVVTEPNKAEVQEAAAREMQQAQEMELAAINLQDENVALKAKVEELTNKLKELQDEFDAYKKKMTDPESWEQKYKKLEADNDVLRKLVQYERGLQEDLLKKVQEDQETINELKSRLEEETKKTD